ncbi:DUF3368 domain-containing protein [Thermococcus pacificus]|uniref:Nucleotide-binding protein n=1 Tax=Thermococcus pacificus TaxID=71998 RepID=A0A218P6T1_9EURY|nr:DUF3368 domain-containing protein [Thermococcus pacificus]ASJ06495.1 nucleotide-binding protein [Thermococcus pacificus]
MRVVFNSSPVIALAKLGYLKHAVRLFGEVFVPEAVVEDINAKEDEVSSVLSKLLKSGEVKMASPSREALPGYSGLHHGELEAIALAKELGAFVILDDLKARKAARLEGLSVIGTVAVLRLLKDAGLLKETDDELFNALRSVGFRIRPELFYKIMGGEL